MNRSLQCAFGMAALLVSSSAGAQTFGNKGQLAISAERLFGFYHDSATVSVNNTDTTIKSDSFSLLTSPIALQGAGTWSYGSPRVAGDYFVIDHLSVGAALGYSHISVSVPGFGGTTTTASGDSFLFAPRAGWAYMFSDIVGIWPRAGFTYRTLSAGDNSGHDFALTAEVPFIFTVIPHVGFWAGPTLDLGISGSQSTKTGPLTQSVDFNATEIGLQTGMTVYFDL
ncbi:MAG: hypothetical protein ABJB12_07445 [Pseudomonadota bacterium]